MLETSPTNRTELALEGQGYVNKACTELDDESSKPSMPNGLRDRAPEPEKMQNDKILYISTPNLDTSMTPLAQSYELSPISTPRKTTSSLPEVEMTDSSGYVIHLWVVDGSEIDALCDSSVILTTFQQHPVICDVWHVLHLTSLNVWWIFCSSTSRAWSRLYVSRFLAVFNLLFIRCASNRQMTSGVSWLLPL